MEIQVVVEVRVSLKEIGRRLAELRKFKSLSQQDLAKFLEIPRSSVAQLELGKRNISVIELMKFAEVLGFSLDKFLAKNYHLVQEESDSKQDITGTNV